MSHPGHPTFCCSNCSKDPCLYPHGLVHSSDSHHPALLIHRLLQETTGGPVGFPCHPFLDGVVGGRPAMPTHHGIPWHWVGWQVAQSSLTQAPSRQMTHDLCSPVWVAGRSQQPLSVPHPGLVPSPLWPLVNKEA